MNRILGIGLFLLLLASCTSSEKRPLLSGLVWGGEGSRMIVKPAGSIHNWSDTLIINHIGEFVWHRDSIQPGFYRLENTLGEALTFFLENDSSVFIDAQYITYPEASKIEGSEIAFDILALEKNTKQWLNEIDQLSKQTEEPDWKATVDKREKLQSDFDSIRHYYRDIALQISEKPLVRFMALLQQAGNNPLFDPWEDRQYYFETDSLLRPFRKYTCFKEFSLKVDSLNKLHLLNEKMKPGSQFPNLSLPNMWGDTIALTRFKGTPCYVEVWNPSMEENTAIHASVVSLLNKYRRQDLETYFIAVDSLPTIWKEKIRMQNLYFQNVIDQRGPESPITKELGIIQLPANFILNEEGIVVAKNIWGNELEKVVGLLLKK